MIRRSPEIKTPTLRVLLGGKEYYGKTGPKAWEVTQTLTNLFDGFFVELDNQDGRNNDLLEKQNPHRWQPITIQHVDPEVDNGRPRPFLMGVVTKLTQVTSDRETNLRLEGYDLGKLFDSMLPLDSKGRSAWYRIRGHTWQQLLDRCIDDSWKAPAGPTISGDVQWGLKGVRSGYLNRSVRVGRYGALQDYGKKYQEFMPPVQIEPGETVYDTLSRFARLTAYQPGTTGTGSFVRCSADGWVEIFNPDDNKDDPPLYTFEYHKDERNQRIKSGTILKDGEQLYTDYQLYSSVLRLPYKPDSRDPNAGKFYETSSQPGYLGVNRVWTGSDAEAYTRAYGAARVDWKRRQALYSEVQLVYEVQGNSWPGAGALSGRMVPLCEGYVADVRDSRNRVNDKMLVESVTMRGYDQPQGSSARITLRRLGLLGA